MFFLLGSIVFTSYLTLSFKVLDRFRIPAFQAIVVNYCTCVVTGSVVNGSFPVNSSTFSEPWFKWALLMGSCFIVLFNIIAWTTRRIGVAVASVSNKLSLIIPAIFFIIVNGESVAWLKITGIILALVSVVLTCLPQQAGAEGGRKWDILSLLMPFILFLGSGVLDTVYKFVEGSYLNAGNLDAYLITGFSVAGVAGLLVWALQWAGGKQPFDKRSILAGICIGIPNYFSIWCLGKVYQLNLMESSAIIPVNNMGIVLFSSVVAWWLFKERLSGLNWLGIVLSLAAIAMIAFGG